MYKESRIEKRKRKQSISSLQINRQSLIYTEINTFGTETVNYKLCFRALIQPEVGGRVWWFTDVDVYYVAENRRLFGGWTSYTVCRIRPSSNFIMGRNCFHKSYISEVMYPLFFVFLFFSFAFILSFKFRLLFASLEFHLWQDSSCNWNLRHFYKFLLPIFFRFFFRHFSYSEWNIGGTWSGNVNSDGRMLHWRKES